MMAKELRDLLPFMECEFPSKSQFGSKIPVPQTLLIMHKVSLIISFGLQIFLTILVGREAEIKKNTSLSTPHFILQELQTFFCYLVGRRACSLIPSAYKIVFDY
jgi:hypothetical protein